MALTKVPSNLDATVATTQAASDNSTNIATTAYVTTAIANLVDGAPSTLNTLDEIAAALNDDAALNTTLTNSIATKLPLAGGNMTGDLTVDTDKLLVDISAGRVGINTTSLTADGITIAGNTSEIDMTNTSTNGSRFRLLSKNDGHFQIFNKTDSVLGLHINDNGHVGIGTSSPYDSAWGATSKQLTISGTDYGVLNLIDTGGPTRFSMGAGDGKFYMAYDDVNSAHRIVVDSTDVLVGSTTNLNVLSGTPKIQVGDGSGHSSIQWYSGSGSVAGLYFGDASSGGARYSGYIEYRHNNNSMAFQAEDLNSLVLRKERLDVCTGVTEARITLNGTGTAGTNNSNWIRGSSNILMYNSAGAYHAWEIGGTENMRLHHDPSASQGHLTLSDSYPWIDLVAPDGAYFKSGLTARGGSSSTQGQFHLHITRDSGFRKLSTAGNYDTYLVTETANTAYGNLRIGVDQTECIFIDAGTKGVAIVGGPTNNASSTYQVDSVLEVNGAGSTDCASDGKLTVTKNNSGDWSIQTIAGSDDYGFKTVGNGGYAYAVYNQPSSAYRMRLNYNGELYLNGGSSALFNINSDARLKEDITDCPSQWDLIKGLPLQRFHWKDRREGDKWSYGFIAQEVEKTNPEFVQTVQDAMADTGSVQGDYKTVAEGQIHERALAALQEAMARIETLEAEVTALKG